jgi:hypothetical protein
MTDIVNDLRDTAFDKDNLPRMKSERACPVGLALKAADEIERIRQEIKQNEVDLEEYRLDVERLRAALEKISTWPDHRLPSPRDIARAALEKK